MASVLGTTFGRATTLARVRAAGVRLSEVPDETTPLRVICTIVPDIAHGWQCAHRVFAVQARREGCWESLMAELVDEEKDANELRAGRVFGATPAEEREMASLTIQAVRAAQVAVRGSGTAN